MRLVRCVAGAVLGATLIGVMPAAHAEKIPVPYNFLGSAIIGGTNMNGDAPGTNDWKCTPSKRHPRPVVLTHGFLGNKNTNWQTYGPLLKNNGYCVFALTYGLNPGTAPGLDQFGGFTKIEDSARELKVFVAQVLKATGARRVDIVGHSEGTVVPNYYAKFLGGARYIKQYISLAPLWHGTDAAGLASLTDAISPLGLNDTLFQAIGAQMAAGPQLLTGSDFWKKMWRGGTVAVPGIRYTNIVTTLDELVNPYTSGIVAGMTNWVVQEECANDYAEHFEIVGDPVAAQIVLNALNSPRGVRQHKPLPCPVVLPFVGTGV